MYFLTIKSNNDSAELGLYLDDTKVAYKKWQSSRTLSKVINYEIAALLHKPKLNYRDLGGIIIYSGPGSFTGLRIGFAVANALAYSLSIPVVKNNSKDWQKDGIVKLQSGQTDYPAQPYYGSEPHITKPVK